MSIWMWTGEYESDYSRFIIVLHDDLYVVVGFDGRVSAHRTRILTQLIYVKDWKQIA